ncbi:MAG TPA: protein phosphatase 2C domain-containing protein [Trebonia sp.]|nr:protein phosphatase 2C domain-containing protein [Trebonia sp.]
MPATPARSSPISFTTALGTWSIVTGSARGRSHEVRGLPNQDAVAHHPIAAAHGLVVAVADGHGHPRHFRSATGSALAVQAACEVATQLAFELGPLAEPSAGEQAAAMSPLTADMIAGRLPAAIVRRWRAAVARDLRADPLGEEEVNVLESGGDGPQVAYGATLLVAVVAAGWLACAQIGDGDIVTVAPDGAHGCPVPGDDHLDGLHTTSLCQPDAVGSFRIGTRDLAAEPLRAVMLVTDGYGNAQAADPWQPGFARDLALLASSRDPAWFARQLPGWARQCASSEGSGDDTTIALLLAAGDQWTS